MKLRAGVFLGVCAAGLGLHASEPLVSIGPDIPVFLSLSGTVRYDDNIYLQKTDTTSDTVYVIMPGIDFHTSGGVGRAEVYYDEQLIRYASHSSLNSNLADVEGSFDYDGGVSQFAAKASYQEMDQSNLQLRSYDQTVRHNLSDASVTWNAALAGKTSFDLGAQFDRTEYPNVGYVNNAVWSVPFDFYYAVTAKSDLSLGYNYRRTTIADGGNGSTDHFVNVGARGQFTPKLSGQIRTGLTERLQDRGGNDRLFGLSANLNYAYSLKTVFGLQASNDYTNSAYGTSQRVFSTGVTGSFQFTPQWTAGAGLNYDTTRYLDAFGRRDRFWVANVSLTYAVTNNVSLQAAYVFRKNISNMNVEFQGSVASFSASLRF